MLLVLVCTGAAGVCGAFDRRICSDELTGALVGLSRTELAAGKRSNRADQLIVDGLFTCIKLTSTLTRRCWRNYRSGSWREEPSRCRGWRRACWWSSTWRRFLSDNEDIRSLPSFSLVFVVWLLMPPRTCSWQDWWRSWRFLCKGTCCSCYRVLCWRFAAFYSEVGEVNLMYGSSRQRKYRRYGTPVPTEVPLTIEPGPFIVTWPRPSWPQDDPWADRGAPWLTFTLSWRVLAHGYPELKKYPQLTGNFGTAWQNQQKEFAGHSSSQLSSLLTASCHQS